MEVAFQAPHVRILAGGTHPNSDDCVLRARRDFRNVPVEVGGKAAVRYGHGAYAPLGYEQMLKALQSEATSEEL